MTHLVPIKVKIVVGPDGAHGYPPFNQLDPSVRGHLDWSKFFDVHGIGWHYDKLSGLGETDAGNDDVPANHPHRNDDRACWYGATCVPKPFAEAAAAKWPDLVTILDEASFESFYDDRAHANEEAELLDREVLAALKLRIDLENDPNAPTTPPSAEALEARRQMLDPASDRPGIRKNKNRRWADYKKRRNLQIDPARAKPAQ